MLENASSFNPLRKIICGNFDARPPAWWKDDAPIIEGTEINSITIYHDIKQLIQTPIHLHPNLSSCINPIFMNEANIVCTYGFHPLLYSHYCHQINLLRFNINFHLKNKVFGIISR